MWWCDKLPATALRRGGAVLACLLFLTSCGFQPLYGTSAVTAQPRAALFEKIEVASIPNREGQYLRNRLIDRLYQNGYPASAPYLLQVTKPSKATISLGVRKDATSTRGQVDMSASFVLTDRATGAVLLRRKLSTAGGYNRLDNQYATIVSERDVTDNLLDRLSDDIIQELALFSLRQDFSAVTADAAAPLPDVAGEVSREVPEATGNADETQ